MTIAIELWRCDTWTAYNHFRECSYHMIIRQRVLFFLLILIAGCASASRPVGTETYDYANQLFEKGLYGDARDAYRYLDETYPKTPLAEKAEYNAAYILVYYKNLNYDYDGAEREFSSFLKHYPASKLADQAQTWLAVLKSFDQSKTHELMMEVELLSKKIQNFWTEIEDRQADEEKLTKEKDSLLAEKEELSKKADDLLKEKERLLSEKAAVTVERDGLIQDKITLQRRVFSLTEEKNDLILAKKKLEKSLRDLTMVDQKMKTQRKKIKKEEISKDTNSTPR
jgi:outer membrane lipoprotein YfiO